MRSAVILTIVLAVHALAGAASARADRWKPRDVLLAMQVADAHWPSSPCFDAHQTRWLRGWELDALFRGEDPSTTAVADVGGCRVWLAWDRIDPSAVWLCTILEHEYGHNAGAGHSNDANDVMYPWQANTAPDCRRAFARHVAARDAQRRSSRTRHDAPH